jgi:hypothetical protein
LGFFAIHTPIAFVLIVPYWISVVASSSVAMAFQLRWPWRFNLRSLFIATMFLAVVLGNDRVAGSGVDREVKQRAKRVFFTLRFASRP